MKISSKGTYALLIMTYLANHYNENRYISLKEISENENISYKYLEKIMITLNKNNFLDVARGNNGGYKLKSSPNNYKVLDILKTVDENLLPVKCIEEECDKKDNCSTIKLWSGLYDEINSYLGSKTLADYIKEGK
ncbi:MAG: Rrf2 family transcriptional regulator [Bacilli bacterium]|nr:Rrf2 family transcriptional regulator [Bacilli bacterium]